MMLLQNFNFQLPKIFRQNLTLFILIIFIQIASPQTLKSLNFDLLSIWIGCLFLSEDIHKNLFIAALSCLFLETYYGLPFSYFITKVVGLGLVAYSFKINFSTEKSRTWFLYSISTTCFYSFHLLCFLGFGKMKWNLFLYSVMMYFIMILFCSSFFHTNHVSKQKIGVYY